MPGKKQTNTKAKSNASRATDTASTSTSVGKSTTSDVSDLPIYSNEERDLVDSREKEIAGKRPVHVRVAARQGESVEQMLRRFNFAVTKSDLIQRLRDLQFYEKPSKKRQREEKLRSASLKRSYDD